MTLNRDRASTAITVAILLLVVLLIGRIAMLSMSAPPVSAAIATDAPSPRNATDESFDGPRQPLEIAAPVGNQDFEAPVATLETGIPSDGHSITEQARLAAGTGSTDTPSQTAADSQLPAPAEPRPAHTEPSGRAAEQSVETAELTALPTAAARKPGAIRIARRDAAPTPAEADAGPRYQRLDLNGNPVSADQSWSCVRDNRRDLVWEVKTTDGGLRDVDHLYSWYDPASGERRGSRDGGRCSGGIDCDTRAYPDALNRLALCGFSDWRLPSKLELQTLVAFDESGGATIDPEYFPATAPSWYWSASSDDSRPGYAWYVLFRNGIPLNDLKQRPKHVRLVRGNRLLLASNR